MDILNALNGWKTHILVVLMIVVAVLNHFQLIDASTFKTAMTVLGGLAVSAVKSGQNRIEQDQKEIKERIAR